MSHAVRWEDLLSYCIKRFLQLNTSTFWRKGGMQIILEPLLYRGAKTPWATDWLCLVQLPTTHFLQNSAFAGMWEQLPSQEGLPSVCCHHIRLWFIESGLIFLSPHTQLNHWCICQWLFLSPLAQQSRTSLYCELLHYHQEQVLVVLLTEYWMVVARRTGQVIWKSSEMTCVLQFFAACMIIIL